MQMSAFINDSEDTTKTNINDFKELKDNEIIESKVNDSLISITDIKQGHGHGKEQTNCEDDETVMA